MNEITLNCKHTVKDI
uniref:Uncharacterized protein n=1 Tax=Arundo donax TaxID=35708 RepID=A0A0A9E1U5_ARUDO